MNAIFMNSENSKTSKLTNKLDLRIGEKVIALPNLSIYYTWRNIKTSHNNNKFKISTPTWYNKFELPDGSYSVSIFKIILNTLKKNMEKILMNHCKNICK